MSTVLSLSGGRSCLMPQKENNEFIQAGEFKRFCFSFGFTSCFLSFQWKFQQQQPQKRRRQLLRDMTIHFSVTYNHLFLHWYQTTFRLRFVLWFPVIAAFLSSRWCCKPNQAKNKTGLLNKCGNLVIIQPKTHLLVNVEPPHHDPSGWCRCGWVNKWVTSR